MSNEVENEEPEVDDEDAEGEPKDKNKVVAKYNTVEEGSKKKTSRLIPFTINLGDDIDEAVANNANGLKGVLTLYYKAARVQAQSIARTLAARGKNNEEIVEFMSEWKPGQTLERLPTDPKARFATLYEAFDIDGRRQALAALGLTPEAINQALGAPAA